MIPFSCSGEFRVYEDTQLVQQDLIPGVHVYVHYFTLYDVRARGFVRPMCLSYISSDYRKLLHYFSQLKQKFTAVSVISVSASNQTVNDSTIWTQICDFLNEIFSSHFVYVLLSM